MTPRQWTNHMNETREVENDHDENNSRTTENNSNVRTTKPKSIIEKFESLMMSQQNQQTTTTTTTAVRIKTQQQTNENRNSGGGGGGGPSPVPSVANSTSLTYVSSVMESTAAAGDEGDETRDNNEYCDYDGDVMLESKANSKRRVVNRESGSTSLFDEDDDEDERQSMASTYTSESAAAQRDGAYSISGSSYTADMMNQDDFDDQDDLGSLDDGDEVDDDDNASQPIEDDYDNIDDDQTTNTTEMTCQAGVRL